MQNLVIPAYILPCKSVGEDEYLAGIEIKDLRWLEHVAMIPKVGNEPMLQAVVRRVFDRMTKECKTITQVAKEE